LCWNKNEQSTLQLTLQFQVSAVWDLGLNISCHNRRRLLSWGKAKYDVQIVTFARLKDTQKIAAITTSPKELLHRPLRSLVSPLMGTNDYSRVILYVDYYRWIHT